MSNSARIQDPSSSFSPAIITSAASSLQLNGELCSTSSGAVSTKQGSFTDPPSIPSEPLHMGNDYKDHTHGEYGGDTVRWHRHRHSGGFLLEPSPVIASHSGNKRHTIYGSSTSKGKRREDEMDFRLRHSKERQPGHRPKHSIGSSPLSMEVTNAITAEDHGLNGASSSETRQKSSALMKDVYRAPSNGAQLDGHSFDTDPAQIVKLALNLSETRRRQASIGRLSPIGLLGNDRRVASTGLLGPAYPLSPAVGSTGGSLRYHLQQQRKGSRNPSPRSDRFGSTRAASTSERSEPEQHQDVELAIVPGFDLQMLDDPTFNPSEATLLRAEKARTTLELLYEYRRLLQFLPKLPVSPQSRPGTGKGTINLYRESAEVLGRTYNPLQYVRNRKIRIRERKSFNAEGDGWNEVSKVRRWVHLVATERIDPISHIDGKYPLPRFDSEQLWHLEDDLLPTATRSRATQPSGTKPSRPRSDWVTTPWDLLADAYWLELDDHKKLIEDHEGHKVFSTAKSQIEPIPRSSREIPRLSGRRSASIPRSSRSPEKQTNALEGQDSSSKERGRQRHQLRNSTSSLHEYSSSQDRKSRWHRKLIRSQSSSSSEGSAPGSLSRQSHLRGRGASRERQDSAVLERQVMDLLSKEAENINWGSSGETPLSVQLAAISGKDTISPEKYNGEPVEYAKTGQSRKDRDINSSPSERSTTIDRTTLQNRRMEKPRTSLDGYDSTAPSSPIENEVVPSIAINLSPPTIRPIPPRKPLPFQHRLPHLDHSTEQTSVEVNDSAIETNHPGTQPRIEGNQGEVDPDAMTSPSEGFLSPKRAEGFSRVLRRKRSDSKSLKDSKEHRDSESKIRGLFKGSRLVDMVGHPVTKVGDLLWRKDGSNHRYNLTSPASSCASEASGTDDDLNDMTDENGLSRSSTHLSATQKVPMAFINGQAPKYHMSNLPSFKSPNKVGRRKSDTPPTPQDEDHIGRQQLELRERGRSPRFNRLAPPSLDMRSVSPSPTPSLRRFAMRETDVSDESRRPSATPSEIVPYWSDKRTSALLGLPGKLRQGAPPMTGLAILDSKRRHSSAHPELDSKRHWSIADEDIAVVRDVVTQNDITRVRALLLSSGVKANEIVRRARKIPNNPSRLLQEVQSVTKISVSSVPRSEAHVLAARLLIKYIDENNTRLHQAAEQLSHSIMDSFHEKLKSLDSHITKTLTPLVRSAADDADALSAELSTSYLLSVKRLNDSIDNILRRKRRRFRWVRRSGYLLLEWMLLGAMWWVWLVVVIVRLLTGVIGAVWRAGKWLLCL